MPSCLVSSHWVAVCNAVGTIFGGGGGKTNFAQRHIFLVSHSNKKDTIFIISKREFRRKLRNLYIQLEHELFNDIDRAAETDQHLFWTLINRNNGRKFKLSELIVDGKTFREPEKISQAWADYFCDLYTPKNYERYDDQHKLFVERSLSDMTASSFSNNKPILDDDICLTEVVDAIKTLKSKKACGYDSISNEHLIHGGDILNTHLRHCLIYL